jgi:hypothetical protein
MISQNKVRRLLIGFRNLLPADMVAWRRSW